MTEEEVFWEEQLVRALARMVYEQSTGIDWHLSARDPGLDPEWRQKVLRDPRWEKRELVKQR